LWGYDSLFNHIPVSFNANLVVVDLDHVDRRSQIALADGNRKMVAHVAPKPFEQSGIDKDWAAARYYARPMVGLAFRTLPR
jgi:hypothetical protein